MRQRFVKLAVLGLAVALSLTVVHAQDDEAFIEYRQKVMQGISANMGAIGGIMKNKLPYGSHIATHASEINTLSTLVEAAFKKEITAGKTDAKPEIWQDWQKFAAAVKTLGQESAKLAAMASGTDMAAVGEQVKALGKACGDCHKPFRKPKEESYKNVK
jgi:cytochrome c556